MRAKNRGWIEVSCLSVVVVATGCTATVVVGGDPATSSPGSSSPAVTAPSGEGGASTSSGPGGATTGTSTSSGSWGGGGATTGTSTSPGSGGGGGATTGTSTSSSSGLGCPPAALVGIALTGSEGQVTSLDPSSGVLTALGPGPGGGLALGFSGYDPATKTIYEFGGTGVTAIDGVSGAVLFATPIPDFNRVYNPAVNGAGQIIAIDLGSPASTAMLDPHTGTMTDLAPLPYSGGFGDAQYAVDPISNRVYQIGDGFVLTIDGATGALLASAAPSVQNFVNPVVNVAGQLVGVHLGAPSPSHLARLDPTTGIVTDLAEYWGVVAMGGMAYDPCTNRVYQLGSGQLTAFDGTTGEILGQVGYAQQNFLNFQAVW